MAGILVAGVFLTRAAIGVPAAWAYRRGQSLELGARYAEAGEFLDRGAFGSNRVEALWRAGRSRLELWDSLPTADRAGRHGDEALRAAAERFLAGRAASPGSAWFTSALGEVYARRETMARSRRVFDLEALSSGPWAVLGDDGRIAIGLARTAIAREPNRFELRDQLVLFLEANGLREDALKAMADSARVLPDFMAHADFSYETLPRDLVEMFWTSERAVSPEDAPLLPRGRWLVSSGQLGRRLGHLDEAEQDLRAALQMPGTKVAHAEASFHLGLVLMDRGRFDEAETLLARAAREPVFGPGVAGTRAHIAVLRERWPEALEQLREARRLQPRELWILLEFSRVAQKMKSWDQAEESLRWAMLVHPEDPAPHRALVEMFLAKGEKDLARRELDEYVRSYGTTDDGVRLERLLAEALDPARR
jgi:tetratricopeptide (TPR) repeat protein